MDKFKDVIKLWPSLKDFASDIDEKEFNVQKWCTRNSIPSKKWISILSAADNRGYQLTAVKMAEIAAIAN